MEARFIEMPSLFVETNEANFVHFDVSPCNKAAFDGGMIDFDQGSCVPVGIPSRAPGLSSIVGLQFSTGMLRIPASFGKSRVGRWPRTEK
jgi:hypothetical protein